MKDTNTPIQQITYHSDEIKNIIEGRKSIIQGISDNDLYKFTMQTHRVYI